MLSSQLGRERDMVVDTEWASRGRFIFDRTRVSTDNLCRSTKVPLQSPLGWSAASNPE